MQVLLKFLFVLHFFFALSIIGLVLAQTGKGSDVGAAFGSGGSGSLFGPSGASNFFSRTTAICVTLFFITSLLLTCLDKSKVETIHESVIQSTKQLDKTAVDSAKTPIRVPN